MKRCDFCLQSVNGGNTCLIFSHGKSGNREKNCEDALHRMEYALANLGNGNLFTDRMATENIDSNE